MKALLGFEPKLKIPNQSQANLSLLFMFNVSFVQILVLFVIVFLLFGDFEKFHLNFKKIKNYFFK
jgi:hypothetical protein